MSGPVVVLVGPPGAGKSTVGAALAARLGVEVRDTDADVEAAEGMSVQEIFLEHGEPRFRELEEQSVAVALGEHDGVLSLGGGAVLSDATRTLLAEHPVVFLDLGLAAAASRVGLGTSRPLLLGNVRGRLKALLDDRRPLYTDVADVTVVTDDLEIDEVVTHVHRWLEAR